MKKNRLIQTTACAMALSAALTVSAFAATNVTATLRPDVTVRIDGVTCDFYNAQGKEVHPIIYNGTTYVPIRAVSNAFGADIGYDRNTQTISIYDDFTEIVTAAYKLERTITICRGELDLYNESINANLFTINPATRNPDSEAHY